MKNLKTLLALFVVSAVLTSGAFAQDNDDVEISATILSALTVTTSADIAFGNVDNNTDAFVQANANDAASSNATAPSAGQVDISGAANNAALVVSWTETPQLEETTNNNLLDFTPSVWFDALELTTFGGSNITLTGTTGSIDIGGNLGSAGQPAGTYVSDASFGTALVVTVDYQ